MANKKKETNSRSTKRAKAATAKREGGTYPEGVAKRKDKRTGDNPCLCGCGRQVRRFFSQGHDARVKGWLKAKAEGDETVKIPDILSKALAGGLVLKTAGERPTVLSGKAGAKAA